MSRTCRLGTGMPQYSKRQILAIWLAAAVPMGLLAWGIAPHFSLGWNDPEALRIWLIREFTSQLILMVLLVISLEWIERVDVHRPTLKRLL